MARVRMSLIWQIRAAVLDPATHPLDPEQLSAMLGSLPTAEELEVLKEYTGEPEALGRVERYFYTLRDVKRLEPRLQVRLIASDCAGLHLIAPDCICLRLTRSVSSRGCRRSTRCSSSHPCGRR